MYDPHQKNIVLVSLMRVLISWGTEGKDNDGIGIDANGGGRGRRIRPPSSRHRACRAADLLARDASCSNLCTPLHKAVAGSCPLAAQLLVRALPCRGVLREAMQVRDASGRTLLESTHPYALMPPNKAETEGAWVCRREVEADGVGANWVACLRLLERAGASLTRVGGVSLRSGRRTEKKKNGKKN